MAGLNAKQKLFVEKYLTCFNGSEAARQAGYAINSAGYQAYDLLKKPQIQKAIQDRISTVAMEANETLARLSKIARGEIPSSTSIGLKGPRETYEVIRALEILAKHHKLVSEHIEATVTFNLEGYEEMMVKVYGKRKGG